MRLGLKHARLEVGKKKKCAWTQSSQVHHYKPSPQHLLKAHAEKTALPPQAAGSKSLLSLPVSPALEGDMHCDVTVAQQQSPQLGSSCKPGACQRNQASCWLQPPLLYLRKETRVRDLPISPDHRQVCSRARAPRNRASTEVGEVETC